MVQADEQREQQENGAKVASFRVELFLWAKGLANLDKFSKSDPICVVELNLDTQKRHENGDWMQIDRTEPIMNELNPKWAKKVLVDFEPDKPQELRFSCYDIDSDKNALTYHDFLGRCQCLLADILHAPNGTLKMRLKKVTGAFAKGEFSVHAEKVPNGAEPMVHFEVRGLLSSPAQKQHHAIVGNKGATMIKPTPPTAYLEFYRLVEEKEDAGNGRAENSASPQPLMVHRTEKVKSIWYPQWQNFEVPLRLLSHGQRGRDFLVHCLDKEANESHRLIGVLRTSVDRLTVDHRWRVELANVEKENQNVLAKASPSRIRLDPTKKQGHLHFIHVRLDSAGGKVI